ncbi:hypothetical protein [Aquabacterium sp.]|uniref:hypothetical protein n=1 Tax=Aquabacterium sp. TaxID=1872578 RepID=UPI0025C47CAF|nr:hypothetical protein [Aquabacterium sp.]
MDLLHMLPTVLLLAFFAGVLRVCAWIGGVTREDFQREDSPRARVTDHRHLG